VDDICSSGGTLRAALELLRGAGAGPVEIIVTHALFSAETGEMLRAAGARAIRSTDSCTHPSNAFGLAPLFAAALKKELQA
jgi:ribose-phosphate pyrophosphokinase